MIITKKKFLQLLNCDGCKNFKVHLRRKPKNRAYLKFRMIYEGSFLKEYFIGFEEAKPVYLINEQNIIYDEEGIIVFKLEYNILCIVTGV